MFPAFAACLDQERIVMRWAPLRDGGALEVGRAILDDPWGEVMGPGGELLREILVPHMDWTSTTWISADGIAYQRTFNPWTDEWTFGETPKAMGETAVGELTLHVGAQQMRLVRALALAWVDPPPWQGPFVAVHTGMDAPGAHNVGWVRRADLSALDLTAELYDEPSSPAPEVVEESAVEWRPVQLSVVRAWPWGTERRFESDCALSHDGALVRRPDGSISRALHLPSGEAYHTFPYGATLLEELLPPEEGHSYRGGGSAEKKRPRHSPPRVEEAFLLFSQGMSIEEVAEAMGASRSLTWRRLHEGALVRQEQDLPINFWERVLWHVPLREAIADLADSGDSSLGETLRDLREELPDHVTQVLDEDDLFGMLRLARQYELRHRTDDT